MTEDDFLTMTLPSRIKWLHSSEGPSGKLSHDRFAALLGTTRQTIINWEKPAGHEPDEVYRAKLAEFSGFREEAFSRREAEELVEEIVGVRLRRLEEEGDRVRRALEAVLAGLTKAGIEIPDPREETRSAATAAPASPTRKRR